jgi:hypothetical protein
MSVEVQKRRFKSLPATSGLPPSTDIIRPVRLIRLVQEAEIGEKAEIARPACVCAGAVMPGLLQQNLP